MKKNLFYIVYIALVICIVLYSDKIAFSVISYRHILTVCMALIIMLHGGRWLKSDKYFNLFLVFVFFWGLSSVFTGFGEAYLKKLLGTVFTSYILYQATKLMIIKYKKIQLLVYPLLIIGVVDSIVTIMQYFHNPIGYIMPQVMDINFAEEYMEFAARREMAGETDFVVRGIIGASEHAYFSSCMAVLALYSKKGKINLINIALWVLFVVAIFFIQERSGMLFGLVGTIYIIYVLMGRSSISGSIFNSITKIIASSAVVGVLYYLSQKLLSTDTRYFNQGFDDGGRSILVSRAMDYLFSNPLGGFDDFIASGSGYPHNLIINAWLFGGLLGGSIAIYLIIIQSLKILKNILIEKNTIATECLVFGMMYLVYTGNSLVHNMSLVTGASIIWAYWAVFLSYDNYPVIVKR